MTAALDIVIVVDRPERLEATLAALAAQDDVDWRAIGVDTTPTAGTRDAVPGITRVAAPGEAFVPAANRGLAASDAPYALLLACGALAQPGCLGLLFRKLELEAGVGLLAARLLDRSGRPRPSCVPADTPASLASPDRDCELLWASTSALVVRRYCLEAIGELDAGKGESWARRARAARWRVALCAEAEVVDVTDA